MKNKVIYAVLAAMFPLVGCTQSGSSGGSPELVEGTVGISVPAEVKTATDDNTQVRYIMQAWTVGENGASGELAFEYVWTGRTVGEGLNEPVRMIPGVYNILFWADRDADRDANDGGTVYDARNLNNVRVVGLQSGGSGTGENSYVSGDERDAFCGVLKGEEFKAGKSLNIKLERPLARVVVTNAAVLPSEMIVSLTATGIPTGYNVLTGESLTESAAGDLTITYPNAVSNQSEIFTDYFFPPVSSAPIEGTLKVGAAGQTLSLGSEDIVANYTTNITLNLNF